MSFYCASIVKSVQVSPSQKMFKFDECCIPYSKVLSEAFSFLVLSLILSSNECYTGPLALNNFTTCLLEVQTARAYQFLGCAFPEHWDVWL